jgi:hypothetical protein
MQATKSQLKMEREMRTAANEVESVLIFRKHQFIRKGFSVDGAVDLAASDATYGRVDELLDRGWTHENIVAVLA